MTDPAATLATPTVHVVDDDPQVAKALARLLREHGFRTAVFDSAEAFLAQCDVSAPGCLVLDANLPGLAFAVGPSNSPLYFRCSGVGV